MGRKTELDPGETRLAESFGNRVRERREAAGIEAQELARRAGMSKPYLSRVENGRTLVSIRTMGRLAKSLGISLATLCEGVDASALTLENRPYGEDRPPDR